MANISVLGLVAVAAASFSAPVASTPEVTSSNWMSAVADDKPISEINIPGTHDSGTSNVYLSLFAGCQKEEIADQLEDGYRYLDIRLRIKKDDLVLCHGSIDCKAKNCIFASALKFSTILSDCESFLDANPSETIVMSIKHEDGDEPEAEFHEYVANYFDGNGYIFSENRIPTLGEARGKIVFQRRYGNMDAFSRCNGMYVNWSDQGDKDNTSLNFETNIRGDYKIVVQDRYNYKVEDKWAAFTANHVDPSADTIVYNFLSTTGSGLLGIPETYAKKLNKKLDANSISNGWSIFDFATEDQAKLVYTTNY